MEKDLRIMKTEESLQQALLTLLNTKSLESITVSELCRLAKVNRGTFYHHYRNIHELFKNYFEQVIQELKEAYEEPYSKTNQQIQKMTPDMVQIFSHVKTHQAFYQIIFDEKASITYYYLIFDTLRTFIGKSLSSSGEEKRLDTNYQISFHANAILGLILEWHQQNYVTPVDTLNEKLMKLVSI